MPALRAIAGNPPLLHEHRGRQLVVARYAASGRLCVVPAAGSGACGRSVWSAQDTGALYLLLDRVPVGLMQCDAAGGHHLGERRVCAVVRPARSTQQALGRTLEEVFRRPGHRLASRRQRSAPGHHITLREVLRFTGAPFELTLPDNAPCVFRHGGRTPCTLYAHGHH